MNNLRPLAPKRHSQVPDLQKLPTLSLRVLPKSPMYAMRKEATAFRSARGSMEARKGSMLNYERNFRPKKFKLLESASSSKRNSLSGTGLPSGVSRFQNSWMPMVSSVSGLNNSASASGSAEGEENI